MKGLILALLMALLPIGASASVLPLFQAADDIKTGIEVLRGNDPRDAMAGRAAAEAAGLPPAERQDVYRDMRISLAAPAFRSLFIGFGSGSANIGDEKGQVLGAWGDGIGLAAVLTGAAVIGLDWTADRFSAGTANFGSGDLPPYEMSGFGSAGLAIIQTGGVMIISSRIANAARVMLWGSGYNRRLKRSLEMELTATSDAAAAAGICVSW